MLAVLRRSFPPTCSSQRSAAALRARARRPAAARTASGSASRAAPPRRCSGLGAAAGSWSSRQRRWRQRPRRRLSTGAGRRAQSGSHRRGGPAWATRDARAAAPRPLPRTPTARPRRRAPRRPRASPARPARASCSATALLLGSTPAITSRSLRPGQRDIEQPPMLLEVERLPRASISFGERVDSARPCAGGSPALACPRPGNRAAGWSAAELGRIGGGVGQDHDRRLQALGAVDGHHPDRIAGADGSRWISTSPRPNQARKRSSEAMSSRSNSSALDSNSSIGSRAARPRRAVAACGGRRAARTGSSRGTAPGW